MIEGPLQDMVRPEAASQLTAQNPVGIDRLGWMSGFVDLGPKAAFPLPAHKKTLHGFPRSEAVSGKPAAMWDQFLVRLPNLIRNRGFQPLFRA
jgi:hypothetical protein